MKKLLRLAVFVMCMAWLLSLLGCKKGKIIVDGPDMAYTPKWTQFTLSRSDSYAQFNFAFTVTDAEVTPSVSGVCRDEDGNEYETETGIPISVEDLWKLRWMKLEQLPEEKPWPEDLELPLDMESVHLTLILPDGTAEKKLASGNLSMEIYQLLLPYFINNQS